MFGPRIAYLSLPTHVWPNADQELLLRDAESSRDPFADAPRGAEWSPDTWRTVRHSYGRWLAFVSATIPEYLNLTPADRITPEAVHRWLGTLGELAPNTVVGLATRLLMVAQAADSSRDWSWLEAALRRLRRTSHAIREKKVIPPPKILNLGITMMDQVNSGRWHRAKGGTLTAFGQFRDGLILALWSATALRRGEFSSLRIGQNLLVSPDSARIEIPANQRKRTFVNLSIPIPEKVFPYLIEYLERRAGLPRAGLHDMLWVGSLGDPIGFQSIARALAMRTKAAFGIALPPHSMRYSAATWIALNDPTHVNTAMCVLGQAKLATTSRYYIMAQMVAAQKLAIANLRRLRRPGTSDRDVLPNA